MTNSILDKGVHVYDANLKPGADLQKFFESDNLVIATKFFRNQALFEKLESLIIPKLLDGLIKRNGTLRIWSAGCSDGRECYSLAMAANRVVQKLDRGDVKISVLGSDVSRPQIDIARKGEYRVTNDDLARLESFRDCFEVLDNDIWRVRPFIKSMIEFEVRDIIHELPASKADIVLCSLVVLYYEPVYQREIIQHMMEAVSAMGYMYVAPVSKKFMKSVGFEHNKLITPFFTRIKT